MVEKLILYDSLLGKLDEVMPAEGVNFGAFFIDYKSAKNQIIDMLEINKGHFKGHIIKEYQYFSNNLERQLEILTAELSEKPKNIY